MYEKNKGELVSFYKMMSNGTKKIYKDSISLSEFHKKDYYIWVLERIKIEV